MPDPHTAAEVAGSLSSEKRRILSEAELADSFEYWLHEPIDDDLLASDDLVMTPLGLAVKAIIEGEGW